jgi:hypothetical protein
MRPSRSLTAGAERAPIRLYDAKSQFERGSSFSAHPLELREDVSAEGELRALRADPETREAPAARDAPQRVIERRRAVQGRVVANFRPEGYRRRRSPSKIEGTSVVPATRRFAKLARFTGASIHSSKFFRSQKSRCFAQPSQTKSLCRSITMIRCSPSSASADRPG